MDERLSLLLLAEKFADEGNPQSMRACARELFELEPNSPEGLALMAEGYLFAGNHEEAELMAKDALVIDKKHLRARLVLAALAGMDFRLDEAIPRLRSLIADIKAELNDALKMIKELSVRIYLGREIPKAEQDMRENEDTRKKLYRAMLFRAYGYLADALNLAGEPEDAAEAVLNASRMTDAPEFAAELYSKHLFLLNYRPLSPEISKEKAQRYEGLLPSVNLFPHDDVKRTPEKRLRIGYVSPDFRLHAAAYFFAPLLKNFDGKKFSVYVYSTGKIDEVTRRFKMASVTWRDLRGRSLPSIARIIAEDKIDILVDLSGHSQNTCLPIMAYRPAPVQVSGIGYTNTTGLSTIDYFLSDDICSYDGEKGFTEKMLLLPRCHLCYAPGFVREMPKSGTRAPVMKNEYVTFGSFNNFCKVTDEMLFVWRGILERIKGSRLLIKGKICSVPSGRKLVYDRLRRLNFDIGQVELRPYSPNYLEEYRDVDIALDSSPYTGGTTTCEALFMGVPVITLRGNTHGSRLGASILTSADLKELVAGSQMEYIKKAVRIGSSKELLQRYHNALREHMLQSPLMDATSYMKELEQKYREIWRSFCTK